MIDTILFDLDGTLIDSSEGIIKSALYALEYYGIHEQDTGKLYRFIGPPLSESFEKYYGFSPEKAYEAVEKYRERYNKTGIFECRLYPGVEQCIRQLRERGYRIGMASSKPEVSCKRILEHFGILELFDDVTGATFDGRRDKKEDVLEEVFLRLGNPKPEEVLMIGDRKFDIIGAKAWGVDSVGVTYGFAPEGELEEYGATYIADSPDEILDYVR